MIIKVLLIAAALAFGAFLLRERTPGQHLAARRLLGSAVVLAGVAAVIFPGATNWLAHRVGVHRGADLLLYVFVMVFLFTVTALYQRIGHLEGQIRQLARELALRNANTNADVES